MKITDVEFITFYPPMASRYEHQHIRVTDIDNRLLAKVRTDNGLVGYGDERTMANWTPPPDSFVDSLIGSSPFDFINNTFSPALGGALYDVMGKHLEVPAYKLMGQKVRDAVTVAAWTRPAPPEVFSDEIVRAVEQGYMVFKMHTRATHDVMEQTRLAEEVTPDGFKLHYDFNGSRTLGALLPIIAELEKHPVVGFIEDPLNRNDLDGWRRLREKTAIPIVLHRPPLGGGQEIIQGMADIYLLGDGLPTCSIGDTMARGIACGKANVQTIMQLTGGTLSKALALHIAAVLPTMTGHLIALDDQYEEDITTERIPVIEGFSPVPEGPGLGFEVDEEAVAKFASNTPVELQRYVGVLHLPGGRKIYSAGESSVTRLTGTEEGVIRGLHTEYWNDDGTPEFEEAYERAQREGPFFDDDGSARASG